LKEEALYRTLRRACFGTGYRLQNEWAWYTIWVAVVSTSNGNVMWLPEVIISYYEEFSRKIIAHN
jgi:hypothetical protein